MTSIYFVRHAQPEHSWECDRTRPLTKDGLVDCDKVTELIKDIKIDCYFSSPYIRSFNTIKECAKVHNKNILTDERFRERTAGINSNNMEMFQKRWGNFDFCEEGGESLNTWYKSEMLMHLWKF